MSLLLTIIRQLTKILCETPISIISMEYRWRDESFDKISEHHIKRSQLVFQENIDREKVKKILEAMPENPNPFLSSELAVGWSIEQRTAYAIATERRFQGLEWQEIAVIQMLQDEDVINQGISIIKQHGDYWLFEPCIEKIFEMSQHELDDAYRYIHDFIESDFALTLTQYSHPLHKNLRDWDPNQMNSESFDTGLNIYQSCTQIFERGFPNFLALKRILDGKTPENETLQRKSASSVRRELTNSEDGSNSIYFDLIVGKFDVRLRNGISHGDVLYDPSDSEIRIPTENVSYSHDKFNSIIHTNISTAMFLIGTFTSLIRWQKFANMNEEITRNELDI